MPFEMSYTIPRKIYSSRAVEGILRNKNVPSEARDSQIHILRRQKYKFYIDSAVFSFENDPKILPWLNALPLLPRLPNTDSVSLSKPNFEKTSVM